MIKQLDEALKRKQEFLKKNSEYRRAESLFHKNVTGRYIGDLIYGANDGLITTFSIVASAAGAGLPNLIVVILGLANIVADGLSMGASNYLGGKSERDFAKQQRKKEQWEIKNLAELEIEEVRQIYEKKGFKGSDLDRAVKIITSDEKIWLDTMMVDELGILEADRDPIKPAIATFIAFILIGFIPLFAFLVPNIPNPFIISLILSGITLFIVGALRSFVTTVSFLRGGLEMFAIGAAAAGLAYLIGSSIDKLVK